MDPALLLHRELGRPQGHALHLSEGLARKLAVEAVLDGHDGCVNRVAWNEDGSMLATASDDCSVILWNYPDTGRVPIALQTQHHANLFGVAFLPQHNNSRVISGAMDHTVQLHELDAGAFNIRPKYRSSSSSSGGGSSNGARGGLRRRPPAPQLHQVVPRSTVYRCHKSRVKEVDVCLQDPHLFWSAGEDGMIRQYDTRLPDQKAYSSPNVLINLAMAGPRRGLVECKGVDVNATAPHLMAVACGDPYVRVFDRRRVGTDCPGKPTTPALLQLSAPHLPMLLKAGLSRRAHATHASFSSRGDKLVASYHGDHAYVFDITGASQQPSIVLPQRSSRQRRQTAAAAVGANSRPCKSSSSISSATAAAAAAAAAQGGCSPAELACNLPVAAEAAKRAGNSALFEQRYTAAVADFSAALAAAPWVPGLYTQRALAWLKRGWEGDAAFALRDCEMALALVQQARGAGAAAAAAAEQQARLRQVHALKQLGQSQCALAALESYQQHYPHAADSSELNSLRELLQSSVQQRQAYKAKLQQQRQILQQRQALQQRQRQQQREQENVGRSDADAADELQRQQRAAAAYRRDSPPAAAAAAVDVPVDSGSESDVEVPGGGSSSSLGAAWVTGVHAAPGRGFRVDTDIDSDELEDEPAAAAGAAAPGAIELRAADVAPAGAEDMDVDSVVLERRNVRENVSANAAAPAAAAAAAADDCFIGPLLPPMPVQHPPAAEQQQQQQCGGLLGTAPPPPPPPPVASAAAGVAAAAAAVASGRLGAAVDVNEVFDSEDDDSDDSDSDDSDDEPDWMADEAHAESSDDELMMPWYGPSAFAQEQLRAAAGSSMDCQQQQQQQQQVVGSNSRRRPRSGDDCSNAAAAAAAAGHKRQGSNLAEPSADVAAPGNGRGRHRSTPMAAAAQDNSCSRTPGSSSSSSQAFGSWWDELSGGPGRLLTRCMGHCNVQTDIKEAVFLGEKDELVACGSDDGRVFIYRADTGACVRVLAADEDVANCVRCHPTLPVLATSGIDSVVRLWSPLQAACDSSSSEAYVTDNQARMRDGPRLLRGAALPPAALQAALDENPQLLQLLVQQLYGMAATPGAAGTPAAAAAAAGAAVATAARNPVGAGVGSTVPRGQRGEGLGLGGVAGFEPALETDDGAGSDQGDDEEGLGEGAGQQQDVRRRRPRRGQEQVDDVCRVS